MTRMFNTHTLPTKMVKAAKPHECTWCGCQIKKGEIAHYWRSVGDSFTENRMHPNCLAAAILKANFIYKPKRENKAKPVAAPIDIE